MHIRQLDGLSEWLLEAAVRQPQHDLPLLLIQRLQDLKRIAAPAREIAGEREIVAARCQ